MIHYHIRWSGDAPLDWQSFDSPAEAEASAKRLVRPGESYVIEEYDEACPRCRATMKIKLIHAASNEVSA